MINFSMYDVQVPKIPAYKCEGCGAIFYPAPMICAQPGAFFSNSAARAR